MLDPNTHPFLFILAIVAIGSVAGWLGDRSEAASGAGWKIAAARGRRDIARLNAETADIEDRFA